MTLIGSTIVNQSKSGAITKNRVRLHQRGEKNGTGMMKASATLEGGGGGGGGAGGRERVSLLGR